MPDIVPAHVAASLLESLLPAPVRSSGAFLIAANLLPLYGVLAWDWPVFHLMALYWAENVIAGLYTLLRMVAASPLAGIPMGAFFCVHYGLFCTVHGVFVMALFAPKGSGDDALLLVDVLLSTPQLAAGVLLLCLSHGASYIGSIYNGELAGGASAVPHLMMRPYARMVLLHVTLIVGGFLSMALQDATAALAFIVMLKIVADLKLHARAHRRRAPASEPATGAKV